MKIFGTHVENRLASYLDNRRNVVSIARHLEKCGRCRAALEEMEAGRAALDALPLAEAPSSIWTSIESALENSVKRPRRAPWKIAFAATAAAAIIGFIYYSIRPGPRWEIDGFGQKRSVTEGEWIETDAQSRARIKVGEIGTVMLSPNTRARIVSTRSQEHRIALKHGEIFAQISAPPKLFFVDTASGTAVDLGCEYSLNTDEDGSGMLRVTKGWVAFQWNGRESLVPAGASCRTRPRAGPGTPYFEDASDELKRALDEFDETSSPAALDRILAASRVRDTLTLWHLLSRAGAADRGRVYDRIAALTPVPGISRDEALKLDPDTLKHWKDELAWTW